MIQMLVLTALMRKTNLSADFMVCLALTSNSNILENDKYVPTCVAKIHQ